MQAPSLDQFTLSNKIVIYPKISFLLLFEFPYCCLLVIHLSVYNHNLLRFLCSVFKIQFRVSKNSLKSFASSSISLPKKGISSALAHCLPDGLQNQYTLKIKQRKTLTVYHADHRNLQPNVSLTEVSLERR